MTLKAAKIVWLLVLPSDAVNSGAHSKPIQSRGRILYGYTNAISEAQLLLLR